MVKKVCDQICMIRLGVMVGPNARDQIAFRAFHTFLLEVQKWMLATYMQWMHDNNLEIRIAGSSSCPKKLFKLKSRMK